MHARKKDYAGLEMSHKRGMLNQENAFTPPRHQL